MDKRERIVRRVAQELRDGDYVNLGIGMPTLVANFVPPGVDITLHSENGMLGVGPYPAEGAVDPDLINAGKETVSELSGCCYFNSADSFAMVRGGHIDVTVLGALEVDEHGNLANWMRPGRVVGSVGGAADIAAGARKLYIAMEHTTKEGELKIVKDCSYPLTAVGCVNKVFTDVAVISVEPEGLVLDEVAPGWTADEVQSITEPALRVSPDLREIDLAG